MKNLLICTDGSNYAQECCHYGAWLAKKTGATVEVLYVTDFRQFEVPVMVDMSGSLGIQPYEGMIAQLRELEDHKSGFIEESAMEIFKAEGLMERTSFHHETGLLVDSIGDYASRADLILLGKRGESAGFAKEHLGSMLERVVRSVDKPCLVTSRKFHPINRALIAYDGGHSSRAAIEFIVKNELFHSLELHLVMVSEKHTESQSAEWLAEAEKILKDGGMSPQCQVLKGEVETAIADHVEDVKADLLIAGAYGHSRIRKFLIGSTTSDLLRNCRIPVLCFR